MELYHGTTKQSAKSICEGAIDVNYNKHRRLDFGPGFYTTPDIDRARAWAMRKANTRNDLPALVIIKFDHENAVRNKLIKSFKDDLEWGQFVINNRNGLQYIKKVDNKLNNLHQQYKNLPS